MVHYERLIIVQSKGGAASDWGRVHHWPCFCLYSSNWRYELAVQNQHSPVMRLYK